MRYVMNDSLIIEPPLLMEGCMNKHLKMYFFYIPSELRQACMG